MSEHIHKSHNVTVLLYHLVFPAKYRRAVFDEQVDAVLPEVCLEIEKRCEIKFVEIGVDKDHVHFLVQLVPTYSTANRGGGLQTRYCLVTKLVTMLKSLTAREVFKRCPQVKQQLWGGAANSSGVLQLEYCLEFWSGGYFASTVGKHGDEGMIARYVKAQGND